MKKAKVKTVKAKSKVKVKAAPVKKKSAVKAKPAKPKAVKSKTVKAKSKNSKVDAFKAKFAKFKKIVEAKVGKIDWKELSKSALLLLIAAGVFGAFGPQGKVVAHFVWPVFAGATV